MLAALEWLRPQSDPADDDRLPSEINIEHYALRGYRGPELLVAARPLKGAVKLDGFLEAHVASLKNNGFRRVSKDFAERDLLALTELADRADAVRVVPAY